MRGRQDFRSREIVERRFIERKLNTESVLLTRIAVDDKRNRYDYYDYLLNTPILVHICSLINDL